MNELQKPLLSQRQNLKLRQEAVAQAEAAFRKSKDVRARHAARQTLQRHRRALHVLEEQVDAAH